MLGGGIEIRPYPLLYHLKYDLELIAQKLAQTIATISMGRLQVIPLL